MNVSVVIPTRGNVDMQPIFDSLPSDWEIVLWDNGQGIVWTIPPGRAKADGIPLAGDLSVYARYAAIEYASNDLIFTQDDDCVLPPAVFDALLASHEPGAIVANMSAYHQIHHVDAPLLGFGALFQRDLPARAFSRWDDTSSDLFLRTCDVVFAALTPSCCVDVPFYYLPQASSPGRMSRQAGFAQERQDILDKAKALL
jgi:hypothetical protein